MDNLFFVDCESTGPFPGIHKLTEFGAVHFPTLKTFHGILALTTPSPDNPAIPVMTAEYEAYEVFSLFERWLKSFETKRCVMVSDNPAFDFQWINYGFGQTLGRNPFGHSARRISDYYAGLCGDWNDSQDWKRLRVTKHDHNPVNDALGNAEAFLRLQRGER